MNILISIMILLTLPRANWSNCPSKSNVTSNDGYRYTRIDIPTSASVANQECIDNYQGRLVMIKNDAVSEAVDEIIRGCDEVFFIGLEYREELKEEDWYWIDDTVLESEQSRWANGYGAQGTDICACVVPFNQTWVDDECAGSQSHSFICEANVLAITFLPDDYYELVNQDFIVSFSLSSLDGPANVAMYKEPDLSTPVDSYDGAETGHLILKLESVTAEDNGTYVIVATRDGIATSDSTVLFVEELPSINSALLDEVSSPVTGGPDNIKCEANGIPTPTVRWTKNGNDVAEYSNMPGVYQIVTNAASILHIANAISSDDGTYTCTAANQVGRDNDDKTDTKETRLRVFGSPTIIDIVVIGCADDALLVQLSWKANNQSLGINHLIEGTCYGVSTDQCFLVTVQAQSDVYIETSTYVLTKPFLIDIEITVCPDDCIAELTDNKTISVSPNPVTNASVTEMDEGPTEYYCEVRWNSTQPVHAEQSILFKVKETSTPVRERDSSNTSSLIRVVEVDPITDGYSYKTKAEPNTDITFEISVATDCTGDSEAVRAQGQCVSDVAAPYEVAQPSGGSAESVPDNAHGVVVYVPDERNGPISCLFVIVRRGAENADTMDLETMQRISENAANKLSPEKGDEYIAGCISMSTIYDEESITVVLGTGELSNCDVQQISKQTSVRYDGYNWALRNNESYGVSIVTATPNAFDGILLSQSESYTFTHVVPTDSQSLWWISLVVIGTLMVSAGALLMWKYINLEACRTDKSHVYEESKPTSIRTPDNAALHQQYESNYTTVNQSFVYETVILSNDESH